MKKMLMIIFLIIFNKCFSQEITRLEILNDVENKLVKISITIQNLKDNSEYKAVKKISDEIPDSEYQEFENLNLKGLKDSVSKKENSYNNKKNKTLLSFNNKLALVTFIDPIYEEINKYLRAIDNLKFEEKNKILDKKLNKIDSIRNALLKHDSLIAATFTEITNLKTKNKSLDTSIKTIRNSLKKVYYRLDTTKKYYDGLIIAANVKIEGLENKLNIKVDSLSSQINSHKSRIERLEKNEPFLIDNLSRRIDILDKKLITLNLDNDYIKLRLHHLEMKEFEIVEIKNKLLNLNSVILDNNAQIISINKSTRTLSDNINSLSRTVISMNKKIITIEPVPNPKNYKQNKATFNQ